MDGISMKSYIHDVELTPRMFSALRTPSLVAHWNPDSIESRISLRYYTPAVLSQSTFGPLVSGPKHHSLRASLASHSYLSTRILARAFGSCLGAISLFSIAQLSSS